MSSYAKPSPGAPTGNYQYGDTCLDSLGITYRCTQGGPDAQFEVDGPVAASAVLTSSGTSVQAAVDQLAAAMVPPAPPTTVLTGLDARLGAVNSVGAECQSQANYWGEQFALTGPAVIQEIAVRFKKTGSPPFQVKCEVYLCDGPSGKPQAPKLTEATNVADISAINLTYGDFVYTFASPTLTPVSGKYFAFLLVPQQAGDGSLKLVAESCNNGTPPSPADAVAIIENGYPPPSICVLQQNNLTFFVRGYYT